MPSSLIIGAGMAGLTAARALNQHGWDVVVLDKGRSVGGRMATRRLEQARLDHGAQYFTAQTPAFERVVQSLLAENIVAQWPLSKTRPTDAAPNQPRYVGVGGMNTVAKALARNLTVLTDQTVATCRVEATGGWLVETGLGRQFRADTLLITLPAPQALALIQQSDLAITAADRLALAGISYQPCIAMLVALNRPVHLPDGGFRPVTGDVAWVADNAQKGISPDQPSLTIHAGAEFSRAHFNDELTGVGQGLIEQLRDWIPADAVSAVQLHRWRYSLAEQRHPNPFVAAECPFPLLFGGDGFGAGNVEGAFTSGLAMAEFLQGSAIIKSNSLA